MNKKYLITIQTPLTLIVISRFLIENPFFNTVLNIIGVQNQLPNTFCSDLVCNKKLQARNLTHIHNCITFIIPILRIKPEQKVIRKYYSTSQP